MTRLTPMVKNILLINVGIALLQWIFGLPLNEMFGLYVVFSDDFAPYQFFTYMWLHSTSSIMHLFGNMFAVFIFGPMLEHVWGPKRFLTFYLICGIGAGVLFGAVDLVEKYQVRSDAEAFLDSPSPERFRDFILDNKQPYYNTEVLAKLIEEYENNPDSRQKINDAKVLVNKILELETQGNMVGASGAVFGILMAFGMLFPNTEILLYFAIPVKAKYLVFAFGLYALYAEFNRTPEDNVAHLAHLGGMLIAFILLKIWQKDNRRFY